LDAKIKRTGFLATNLLSGWTAIYFSSCQKSGENKIAQTDLNLTETFENSPENQAMLDKILDFKEVLSLAKEGETLKNDMDMSMDEATWYLESIINIFHGFPNKEVDYFYLEDGVIALPKENLQELMNINEVVLYDDAIRSIIIQQLSIHEEDGKHLVQTTLEFNPTIDSLYIKSLIGVESDGRLPYKDYYFGDNLGACDGTFVFETDAAKRLEAMVHYHFITNRPLPPSDCRFVYINPIHKLINQPWLPEYQLDPTPDNYLDFKVFFASDYFNDPPQGDLDDVVKCLDYSDEMLFYKQQYIDLIEEFENDNNKYYSGCTFEGKEYLYQPNEAEYYSIMHEIEFTVSSRIIVCNAEAVELN
jgi:hypothetical protein